MQSSTNARGEARAAAAEVMAALDRQVEHFVPWSCSSSTEHAFPINTDLLLQLMLLSSCCCSGIYLEFTGWLKWPLIFQQHTESICSSAAAEVVPRQAQEPAGRIWGDFSLPTGESRFLPAGIIGGQILALFQVCVLTGMEHKHKLEFSVHSC